MAARLPTGAPPRPPHAEGKFMGSRTTLTLAGWLMSPSAQSIQPQAHNASGVLRPGGENAILRSFPSVLGRGVASDCVARRAQKCRSGETMSRPRAFGPHHRIRPPPDGITRGVGHGSREFPSVFPCAPVYRMWMMKSGAGRFCRTRLDRTRLNPPPDSADYRCPNSRHEEKELKPRR